MQSFQQRVVDEKTELDGKIARLEQFQTQAIYRRLLADEQRRLRIQAQYMRCYSAVLGERIANFPAPHSPHQHQQQPPKVMPAATDEDDDHDD